MITVIPANPGPTLSQLIKDFQEVDLYQTASAKPFPDDLFLPIDGEVPKSSVKGNFLVQIASIQLAEPVNDEQNVLLTITDGLQTVHAVTNGSIVNLKTHGKIGSKLLLTDTIPIQDGYLYLNGENTQFHFGSNTYPRPRSAYRNRTTFRNGDGRRKNDENETIFGKRPPPKTTLIDFMPQLKISVDAENDKPKEQRNGKRRPTPTETSKDQLLEEQEFLNDDSTENDGAFRERRNPLPPRLQRVQDERSRRIPARFPEDVALYNGLYPADPTALSYITGNASTHNPYAPPLTFPLGLQTHLPYGLTAMPSQGFRSEQTTFPYGTNATYFVAQPSENEEKVEQTKRNLSSNDQQQPSEEKRRENPRPRWKVGDFCLARWNEDGEFYYANILQIQPPFCNIVFTEYNTHDKVHFNDLKVVPRDQHFYQYYPQSLVPSTGEFHPYVSIPPDGYLMMPEVPPFPFNSDGTLYMYPTPLTSFVRSTRPQRRPDQNGSTPPIKDDESSSELSKAKPCAIADSPLVLVTADDLRADAGKDEEKN